MVPTGYATRTEAYDGWLKQLAEMAASGDGAEVIPQDVYLADYVGDIPVGLQGYGQVYREGKFELDHLSQALDYGAFSFSRYPFVVVLEGNSQLAAEDWAKLNDLVHGLSNRMSTPITGNHFFFVGKEGAARTADAVADAIERKTALETEIDDLVAKRAE